ncbi:MAG: hypothetical protein VX069_02965 [Cyanobacteriota bacterium]|nr:hypothetical protein [Cyanobacteriota bacterium]
MAICVVVLPDAEAAERLTQGLKDSDLPLMQCLTIPPDSDAIDQVELLSPNLTRQRRQKAMARWLMPFGFLAGLTFTKITTLTTFDSFGPWGQPVIGGLLGMGSGLMGSYAAAASVNSENEDGVRILRNRREEGRWLLLMETPSGIDLPWQTVQRSRPLQVVRLSEQ